MKSKKMKSILDNIHIYLGSLFADKPRIILTLIILSIFIALSIYSYNTFIKSYLDKKHVLNIEFVKKSLNYDNKEDISIIYFYTEWCPYCKKAKPEWDKFSSYVNNFNNTNEDYHITLISIDCEKDTKTADKYNVSGYPTIKLIKNNQVYDYDAKPNKDRLVEFLESSI